MPGGSAMTSAPTVAVRPTVPGQPDQHDVFYLNANSQVIQRLVTGGVAGPEHNLGAVLYPGSTVAAAWRPDGKRLDLFGRGTESALWQKTFTWADGWGAWKAVTAAGEPISDPSATSVAPNQVDIFYRGMSQTGPSQLQWVRLVDGQPDFRRTVFDTEFMVTSPTAVALPDRRVRVYLGVNDPGRGRLLMQVTSLPGTNDWISDSWSDLAMGSAPASMHEDGQDLVAYRDDGQLVSIAVAETPNPRRGGTTPLPRHVLTRPWRW